MNGVEQRKQRRLSPVKSGRFLAQIPRFNLCEASPEPNHNGQNALGCPVLKLPQSAQQMKECRPKRYKGVPEKEHKKPNT